MTENKETKKKQPKVAALPIPSEINLNVNWGGLASELRNIFEEYRDKVTPAPVTTIVSESIKDMSLDSLLEEVNERLNCEFGFSVGCDEEDLMGKERNPFTTFKEKFAEYGFPNNILVHEISLNSDTIYARIDGCFYYKKLDKEDVLQAYEEETSEKRSLLAFKLFPKYYSEEVFNHSFRNYALTKHDYSKYTVPEGVKVENPMLKINMISARIDGELKTAKLLPADYVASLCFGEDGYRKPMVTLEQLAVKYFLCEEDLHSEEKKTILSKITPQVYFEFLKYKLSDMYDMSLGVDPYLHKTIKGVLGNISFENDVITVVTDDKNPFDTTKLILSSLRYLFCKEHNIDIHNVPPINITKENPDPGNEAPQNEELEVVEMVNEEKETAHRSGRRR